MSMPLENTMVPFYDIYLEHTLTEPDGKLWELLGKVRPGWHDHNVQVERLSGGYVNAVWYCRVGEDKLAVRIHPASDVLHLCDRDFEARVMAAAAKAGIAQPVYARFQNGLVCRYAAGSTCLNFKRVNDPRIQKELMRQVVAIHQIPLSAVGAENRSITDNNWYYYLANKALQIPETFDDASLQRIFEEEFGGRERVERECLYAMSLLEEIFHKHPPILCHNDIWRPNMLYDDATGQLRLIDWDSAGAGTVPLELAVLSQDFTPAGSESIAVEEEHGYKRAWAQQYLLARDGRADSQAVDDLTKDVIKATAAVWLKVCLGSLLYVRKLSEDQQKKDKLRYAAYRFRRYLYYKNITLA